MTLQDRARRYLGVELPVIESLLKSAFRKATRDLRGGDTVLGGDKETFIAMKQTYDDILDSGLVVASDEDHGKVLTTISGIPLTALGLGLGPTTNGRDCESCSSKGYVALHDFKYVRCKACDGEGHALPCRSCSMTGKFKLRNGKIVDCRDCRGYGVRIPLSYSQQLAASYHRCPHCLGTGTMGERQAQVRYQTCGACNGAGEIKIYNPVILKGSMAGMSQSERKRRQRMMEEK